MDRVPLAPSGCNTISSDIQRGGRVYQKRVRDLQDGIGPMSAEDWRSLSEKLQDRMEVQKLPIED